jgi:hypothetical protein
MSNLSSSQVYDLARPIVGMMEKIMAYYQDPENERAFQEWYQRKYGRPAPDGV